MTIKTVLITGCSSGFGKLTAKHFAQKGWNVVATMRSPHKETELIGLDNVLVLPLDMTDPQSVTDAVGESMARFGRIDALVNNAGISGMGVFEQWDEPAINALFETNVFGLIRMTQAVLPIMRQQGDGAIVNVSSLAGLVGSPFSSVYSASKFAVEELTEARSLEYAPFNIQFKAVAPGAYETSLYSSINHRILTNGDAQVQEYSAQCVAKMNETIAEMMQQGNQQADPAEVAEKIYQCVTESTPVHNVSGVDAQQVLEMKQTLPKAALLATLSQVLVPSR
ncbi:SDR family oxidoreductase [Ferrimonas lipolytica]|uniref:SDR family oxidoreductase n=1 Tax=Ferrimonas lipolytica TaxID=2724191 RepID=A0A6H1UD93_9GAMM|nr:SDR family oxidoreductase [Ferrimonas lipolytica]QIZ75772.1 SDR family oxidoreductase [Ferrimonas lipolytica]